MSKLWLKGILKLLLINQIPICCFEETAARSLSLKSKSKEIFGALSQEQEQSTSPFSRVLLFWAREGRRRGSFTQSAQCQKEVIFLSQTSFFKISEILSAKEISINYTTYQHLCSSENFQSTQGREIEVLPKKLQKVHKWPINLRNSSRIYNSFYFLSKRIKAFKSHNNVKGGNKVGRSGNSGNVEKGSHFFDKWIRGSTFMHPVFSEDKGWGRPSTHPPKRSWTNQSHIFISKWTVSFC